MDIALKQNKIGFMRNMKEPYCLFGRYHQDVNRQIYLSLKINC